MTTRVSSPYIHTTMRLGDIQLSIISDGSLRMDGGGLYGPVPKGIWNNLSRADRRNLVKIGLNCLLIQAGGKNILVDTGLGDKHPLLRQQRYSMKAGRLLSGLKSRGFGAEKVDKVALTHLHFDHAGGCTKWGPGDKAIPTFPRATYLVQQQEWHEATHATERSRRGYIAEDFMPLEESGQLELLDGDTEVAPGVWLQVTGGHTSGHQMVLIESGVQRAAFLGDVLPTRHHLPLSYIAAWDMFPMDTYELKRDLLGRAEKERWLLVFGHGHDLRAGYPVTRDGRMDLDPQEL